MIQTLRPTCVWPQICSLTLESVFRSWRPPLQSGMTDCALQAWMSGKEGASGLRGHRTEMGGGGGLLLPWSSRAFTTGTEKQLRLPALRRVPLSRAVLISSQEAPPSWAPAACGWVELAHEVEPNRTPTWTPQEGLDFPGKSQFWILRLTV